MSQSVAPDPLPADVDASLTVTLVVSDRTIVVKASGILDHGAAAALRRSVREAAAYDPPTLILDLSRTAGIRVDGHAIVRDCRRGHPSVTGQVIDAA